ncbi:MAG TPA: glycosyltransferase [Devosiaceae bacterium]|jgi:poly(glycerol-phosphate) alpha-glucosyltransferase
MKRPLRVGMLVGSTTTTGGGVPQAVQSLSRALVERGTMEIEVFSLQHDAAQGLDFDGIPLHVAPVLGPRGFSYAPSLLDMLKQRNLDCLHVHGIWMYLSVAAQRWHAMTGRPYIISPHGMLDGWAMRQQRLKKRAARLLYEDAHLGQAACLHALCESERKSIRELGYQPAICVIPNGVDPIPAAVKPPAWRDLFEATDNILLFLGRVTPKKHVLELLHAWNHVAVEAAAQRWKLVVVGPIDAGYNAALSEMLRQHLMSQTVHMAGPAYGVERAAAYRAASAFILPSISEGLPMGALEALSCGLPSLLTPECNLPEAFGADAALRIGTDVDGIARGLSALFRLSDNRRRAMGANGQRLVEERFNWQRSAAQMEEIYRRITASNGHVNAA